MDRIFPILQDLSIDPYLRAAYLRDPQGFLAAAGLSDLSADERAVLRDAGGGRGGAVEAGGPFTRSVFFLDPGPDPLPDPDPPTPQLH